MNRSEYLRQHLSKTLSAQQIDPPRITYDHVIRASSSLLELWNIERKADVDASSDVPGRSEFESNINHIPAERSSGRKLRKGK